MTVAPEHPKFHRLKMALERQPLSLSFSAGVTILSGPNGAGKSTVLEILMDHLDAMQRQKGKSREGVSIKCEPLHVTLSAEKGTRFLYFPVSQLAPKKMLQDSSPMGQQHIQELAFWMARTQLSHGETTRELLGDIKTLHRENPSAVILIDEPELALDMNGVAELSKFLKKLGKVAGAQAIVITHHPLLLLDNDFTQMEILPSAGYLAATRNYMQKLFLPTE